MARTKSGTLTDAELRLMDILWDKGSATVNEVVESLPPDPPLAYYTVLTTLRILEQKGYLAHTKNGRAFVYQPALAVLTWLVLRLNRRANAASPYPWEG